MHCREDVITQRVYSRILYPGLVSSQPSSCGPYDNPIVVDSEPTIFENYVHDLYVDDQLVELSLWDTAGTPVLEMDKRTCH